MESVPKYIIFGLKLMMKCGVEKLILEFLNAGTYLFLLYKIPKITNTITTRTNVISFQGDRELGVF